MGHVREASKRLELTSSHNGWPMRRSTTRNSSQEPMPTKKYPIKERWNIISRIVFYFLRSIILFFSWLHFCNKHITCIEISIGGRFNFRYILQEGNIWCSFHFHFLWILSYLSILIFLWWSKLDILIIHMALV